MVELQRTARVVLDASAPCDACWLSDRCARTGAACAAFQRFTEGKPWAAAPRVPTLALAARLFRIAR
jgi:hypothetical protein